MSALFHLQMCSWQTGVPRLEETYPMSSVQMWYVANHFFLLIQNWCKFKVDCCTDSYKPANYFQHLWAQVLGRNLVAMAPEWKNKCVECSFWSIPFTCGMHVLLVKFFQAETGLSVSWPQSPDLWPLSSCFWIAKWRDHCV